MTKFIILKNLRIICAAVFGHLPMTPAHATDAADQAYIRTLARPGKLVVVIEFRTADRRVESRMGLALTKPPIATGGTAFLLPGIGEVELDGVEACSGHILSRRDGFDGACGDYARAQLAILLRHPKVLFCRTGAQLRGLDALKATCFAYYYFEGSLNSVDMLEEQLVSVGALRLKRAADGGVLRPDLQESETIARQGRYGLWGAEVTAP